MRYVIIGLGVVFLLVLLLEPGCGPVPTEPGPVTEPNSVSIARTPKYTGFAPAKVDIMPLTEFISTGDEQAGAKLRIFVSLLDSFNCQIKVPVTLRFELYEHVQRTTQPQGKRLAFWPDIDINDPTKNNEYWRDFFRAYQFDFDFEPEKGRSYILTATCMGPSGERITGEYNVKAPE